MEPTSPPQATDFSVAGAVSSTDTAAIVGRVHGGIAPLSIQFEVFKDTSDVSAKFAISFRPPASGRTDWDLQSDAQATLMSFAGNGTYTLRLTIVDGNGVLTRQSTDFQVSPSCNGSNCDDIVYSTAQFRLGVHEQTSISSPYAFGDSTVCDPENTCPTDSTWCFRGDLVLEYWPAWTTNELKLLSPSQARDFGLAPLNWGASKVNTTKFKEIPPKAFIDGKTTYRELGKWINGWPALSTDYIVLDRPDRWYVVQAQDGSLAAIRVLAIHDTIQPAWIDLEIHY